MKHLIRKKLNAWHRGLKYIIPPSMVVGLSMAEIEPSVLESQCLDRRIADIATMKDGVQAWKTRRNNSAKRIHWQFTTADARVRLQSLYPKI